MNISIFSDIDSYINDNKERIFADVARLVKYNSVEGEAAENAPFGSEPAKVLAEAEAISKELGMSFVNCNNYIGYAQIGEGGSDCDKYLATITHLDVVPAGEGWTGDPFVMRRKDGYLIGRGVLDDKGPSVLCLYALKYLNDRGVKLKYPVRALLGVNEETGMADVDYYLANFPAPLFCFSPDADFPMCNGEKGIYHAKLVSDVPNDNIINIWGGNAANAVPNKAEALVRADFAPSADNIDAEETEKGIWHITSHGIGGHAAMPDGTKNAIGILVNYLLDNKLAGENESKFLKVVSKLNECTDGSSMGVDAKDDVFQPLTLVGGVIGIENGRMLQSLDSRYPTTTNGAKITAGINAAAEGFAHVENAHDAPPFYIPLDKPEVQACLDAYNEVTGEDAKPYTIGGGTYARDFPNAVSFGPEHPERPQPEFVGPIHGADEGASEAFLLEALKIYILALLKLEEIEF